ncbi:MAG: hypothetical protein IIV46_03300, partial [Phascolarctobacterium sp.]|nr:hypothetical protein [Phascolarctobacterium sp.]
MKSRYNPVLIAVILVGLVCALWVNWNRHTIEQRNNTVEMAMEYENLRKLAALEGLPEEIVVKQFQDAGINSLMVFDTTLERLSKMGAIKTATGSELRQVKILGNDAGIFASVKDVNENAVYIAAGNDASAFEEVWEDLRTRFGAERAKMVSENPPIIEALGSTHLVAEDDYKTPRGILQLPLGLSSSEMRKVKDYGFNVIVRPQNFVNVTEEKIDSIFQRIAKSGVEVNAYMPAGREVVGYPNNIDYMAKKLDGRKLIMLEHYTQLQFAKIDGLVSLAEAINYKAARSYVIDSLEQKKITVGEGLRRWALTDEERNVRVNYIRPYMMSQNGQDIFAMNLQYVKDIVKNVKARGFEIGEAGLFEAEQSTVKNGYTGPYFPNKIYFVIIGLAIIAGAVVYLAQLVELSNSKQLLIWVVLSAIAAVVILTGRGLVMRQALAFGAAVFFPVLSMNVILDIWDKCKESSASALKVIFSATWQLALAVLMSLVGGMYLAAILADSRFLLEIDIYRGVKLTFVMPLVLMTVLYVKRYDMLGVAGCGLKAAIGKVNELLSKPITFKHVALFGVLGFILLYFVARSGHSAGVPVAAIEVKMRLFLEQLMYARPRQKEFMIGHPAFFLAVYAAYHQAPRLIQYALTCGAVIGQASLVQTFCHMRTPVFMSTVRALDGYAMGAVIGIVLVAVLALAMPLLLKLQRRYLS